MSTARPTRRPTPTGPFACHGDVRGERVALRPKRGKKGAGLPGMQAGARPPSRCATAPAPATGDGRTGASSLAAAPACPLTAAPTAPAALRPGVALPRGRCARVSAAHDAATGVGWGGCETYGSIMWRRTPMERARRTPPSKPVRTSAPQAYDARPRHVYFLSPLAYAAGPAAPARRRPPRPAPHMRGAARVPQGGPSTPVRRVPACPVFWSSGARPAPTGGSEPAHSAGRSCAPSGAGTGRAPAYAGAPRGRPDEPGLTPGQHSGGVLGGLWPRCGGVRGARRVGRTPRAARSGRAGGTVGAGLALTSSGNRRGRSMATSSVRLRCVGEPEEVSRA